MIDTTVTIWGKLQLQNCKLPRRLLIQLGKAVAETRKRIWAYAITTIFLCTGLSGKNKGRKMLFVWKQKLKTKQTKMCATIIIFAKSIQRLYILIVESGM